MGLVIFIAFGCVLVAVFLAWAYQDYKEAERRSREEQRESMSQMMREMTSHPAFSNGIDRVNNNLGYSKSNCVACCTFCNYAKSDHSQEEFIFWIQKAYLTCQNHIQMSQ